MSSDFLSNINKILYEIKVIETFYFVLNLKMFELLKDKIITREKVIPIYQEADNCESIALPIVKRGGSNLKQYACNNGPCSSKETMFDSSADCVKYELFLLI